MVSVLGQGTVIITFSATAGRNVAGHELSRRSLGSKDQRPKKAHNADSLSPILETHATEIRRWPRMLIATIFSKKAETNVQRAVHNGILSSH